MGSNPTFSANIFTDASQLRGAFFVGFSTVYYGFLLSHFYSIIYLYLLGFNRIFRQISLLHNKYHFIHGRRVHFIALKNAPGVVPEAVVFPPRE